MDIDTSTVDAAREAAEHAEVAALEARQRYYAAVAELRTQYGPRATARALGMTEARVYQLTGKLQQP